jgi:hypothetical protein
MDSIAGMEGDSRETIWYTLITLSSALVSRCSILLISRRHLMLITWITEHIYFVWSPDLVRLGFVVCVVGEWISAFTRSH